MARGRPETLICRTARGTSLVAAALLLMAPAAAFAAPTWLAPFEPLPASSSFVVPVMNAGGEILFADRADVGAGKQAFRIVARAPNGAVSAPTLLPPAGSTGLPFAPSLALADDGRAIAAWADGGSAFFALRAPDGTWGAPTAVPGAVGVTSVVAGIDASGTATLGWAENTNPNPPFGETNSWDVKVARISTGGFVGGSEPLTSSPSPSGSTAFVAQLAVAGGGSALVAYGTTDSFGFSTDLNVAFRDGATGPFGVFAVDLGSTVTGTSTSFAIGDGGRSAVAQTTNGANIALRVRDPGRQLGPAANVGAGGSASNVRVGVAANGAITLAWDLQVGGSPRVLACTATPSDCVGDPQTLSSPVDSLNLSSLAVDAAGGALVAWNTTLLSPSVVSVAKAAYRPAGASAFGAEQDIAPAPSANPAVALDADGDGVAAFNAASGGAQAWKAAGFDATGPQIDAFAAPGAVAQGGRADFVASAHDLWSPFGLSWSFGDGAGASGGAVSHAFARAGAFPVTVTATDAVGNSSTRAGSVTVRDTTRPRINRLTMSHRRFRVGRTATARTASRRRAARLPVGTTIHFTLSEAGRASFRIDHLVAGRRVGRACRKPTHGNRRHRACARAVRAGTLTRGAKQGANALAFSGRIGRTALRPGTYRLTLTVADAARNVSTPRTLTFTLVRG